MKFVSVWISRAAPGALPYIASSVLDRNLRAMLTAFACDIRAQRSARAGTMPSDNQCNRGVLTPLNYQDIFPALRQRAISANNRNMLRGEVSPLNSR